MHSEKEYRPLVDELKTQGWSIEKTARGHYKATPPDPAQQIVHFSVSDDHHALPNTIRDLKKRGFVWPPPPRGSRIAKPAAIEEPREPFLSDADVLVTRSDPPSVEEIFAALKDAKALVELCTETHAAQVSTLLEAQRAVQVAADDLNAARKALVSAKEAFDKAFEMPAA